MFAKEKLLRIKKKKSNLMKFNFSRNYDFPLEFTIDGFDNKFEVVKETIGSQYSQICGYFEE